MLIGCRDVDKGKEAVEKMKEELRRDYCCKKTIEIILKLFFLPDNEPEVEWETPENSSNKKKKSFLNQMDTDKEDM